MKIVDINEGQKIDYEVNGTSICFNDELTLDLAKYQRDWDVEIDICVNKDKQVVIGTNAGDYYVAQIQIPAKEYIEVAIEDNDEVVRQELPLNMENVTLVLWSVEEILGGLN